MFCCSVVSGSSRSVAGADRGSEDYFVLPDTVLTRSMQLLLARASATSRSWRPTAYSVRTWTRWSATWWRPEAPEPQQVVAIAGKERLLSDVCTFIAVNVGHKSYQIMTVL